MYINGPQLNDYYTDVSVNSQPITNSILGIILYFQYGNSRKLFIETIILKILVIVQPSRIEN